MVAALSPVFDRFGLHVFAAKFLIETDTLFSFNQCENRVLSVVKQAFPLLGIFQLKT